MSLNHSIYANKLTFQNLDEITDYFSQKMDEHMNTFHLQAEEMNKWLLSTSAVTSKLGEMSKQMDFLNFLQNNISKSLNYIDKEQGNLEEAIKTIECDVCCVPGGKEGPVDEYRQIT
ncbi:unnamed protein product [Acanthoscelides obtectus]|nr:unnamed protein product [Acanthoscelides obtectus]CAK1623126.1 hypothetical protein AOBTE_LOCUS1817 [Acanthoscelides obtectus]